jgi:hypothetical protein
VFSKAALLIAVALVLLGYRWGKSSKAAPQPQQQVVLKPAPAQKAPSWLSVRVLLIIVIILLLIAILTSLQR